jgi:hypothetical protein
MNDDIQKTDLMSRPLGEETCPPQLPATVLLMVRVLCGYFPVRRLALYTVKKAFRYSRPHRGMSLTKLSLDGSYGVIYTLFLPRESLVCDIPAGDGNIEKLFLQCITDFFVF